MYCFDILAINTLMKTFLTYKITNKINGKLYFGWTNKSSVKERLEVHLYSAEHGSTLLLHNAIRKYGKENFCIELMNNFNSRQNVLRGEIKLIRKYKTNHCRYPGIGYNMTDGGEGTSGCTRTKKQLNASSRVITTRNKLLKGQTYEQIYGDRAQEEKLKRGNSNRGKKRSEEIKQKISQLKQGNKNGCFSVRAIFPSGKVVVYPSQNDALQALKIKTRTTLRCIATGKRWRNGKWEKYNSPYNFEIELLRVKLA